MRKENGYIYLFTDTSGQYLTPTCGLTCKCLKIKIKFIKMRFTFSRTERPF